VRLQDAETLFFVPKLVAERELRRRLELRVADW